MGQGEETPLVAVILQSSVGKQFSSLFKLWALVVTKLLIKYNGHNVRSQNRSLMLHSNERSQLLGKIFILGYNFFNCRLNNKWGQCLLVVYKGLMRSFHATFDFVICNLTSSKKILYSSLGRSKRSRIINILLIVRVRISNFFVIPENLGKWNLWKKLIDYKKIISLQACVNHIYKPNAFLLTGAK